MKTMQEVQAMLRDLQQLYTDVRLLDRDAIARIEEGARSDPNGEDLCYACRHKSRRCRHCAVKSAYENHDQRVKLEYFAPDIVQVTARYLEVDGDGLISPEQVMDAIRPDTTLISVMFANNEVGTIEPIYQIGKIAREKQILFHTDAVQAYAQIPLSVNYYPVDLLSASAHKFHGPKGVGFLYIRDGIDIPSFIHGGSQERGKRAGTENVAGIVGMAKAAEIAYGNMRKRVQKEIMLRNYLIERVMHEIPDAKLNGHRSIRLPGNVNFSFKGLEGASLLILLDEDGICASGGSACNTGEERISYVIKALGVPEEYAPGTIRLTLCGDTTRADVDAALVSLKRNIAVLRG